ncbi:hypothetical protein JI435_105690, partial [Parastagonospora nodorum SN15]
AFHRQRYLQDPSCHHPASCWCFPRARLQRRLPHQHPFDRPWLHSWYHPRSVHHIQVLAESHIKPNDAGITTMSLYDTHSLFLLAVQGPDSSAGFPVRVTPRI